MKFLSIYKAAERNTPPSPEEMSRMGKLVEEGFKAGWLLSTEGCLPSALGARVRRSGQKLSVTDGPFTEAKEQVGGFAILQANSKEAAIELAKQFLSVVGEGECEIRQIYEAGQDNCVGKAAS
jgi:hypothetical protein